MVLSFKSIKQIFSVFIMSVEKKEKLNETNYWIEPKEKKRIMNILGRFNSVYNSELIE